MHDTMFIMPAVQRDPIFEKSFRDTPFFLLKFFFFLFTGILDQQLSLTSAAVARDAFVMYQH